MKKILSISVAVYNVENCITETLVSIPGDSEPPFRLRSTAVPFSTIPRFRESDTEVPVR